MTLAGLVNGLDGVETNSIVGFRGLVGSFVGVDTKDTDVFVGLTDLCILEDFVGLIKRDRVDCGRAMVREAVGVAADLDLLVDVSSSLRCFTRFSVCRSVGARSAALLGEENWQCFFGDSAPLLLSKLAADDLRFRFFFGVSAKRL